MRDKGDDVSQIELCFHLFYKLEFLYIFIKKEKKKTKKKETEAEREFWQKIRNTVNSFIM